MTLKIHDIIAGSSTFTSVHLRQPFKTYAPGVGEQKLKLPAQAKSFRYYKSCLSNQHILYLNHIYIMYQSISYYVIMRLNHVEHLGLLDTMKVYYGRQEANWYLAIYCRNSKRFLGKIANKQKNKYT